MTPNLIRLSCFGFLIVSAAVVFVPKTLLAQQKNSLKLSSIPRPLSWANSPVSYQLQNDQLTIIAGPKTDMFRDPNVTYNTDTAPKLLFEADQHFVFSSSIEHTFSNKWDGGAIVLIADSLNWIKFCFEKDYTGARRVVSVVTQNTSDDSNSVEISTNKAYFKMAKADNVITLYFSEDNKKWLLVRHLQFNSSKKLKIGFLAQSPTGEKSEVTFAAITYEARKIKDPYAGE